MFERPEIGEKTVLVHIPTGSADDSPEIQEFKELARSAGASIEALMLSNGKRPLPQYFVGTGIAQEIADTVAELGVQLVIFNHTLTPSQERNLEALFKCRVLDRAGLVLDIFAQRARSFEGKLQVELAQLRHLSTRLVRGWTHLERQKGGIGLRGPGETQLETDRRLLADRIKQIQTRLKKVERQRDQGRRARRRAELPAVSLVGYTNAGKSTLFNRLTGADVYVADQLFATLDPTLRKLDLGQGEAAVIADTVGFISNLPHELVVAFRSTLQETSEASLLLHVVDANDPERGVYQAEVEKVLNEIGAGEVREIRVFNKIDLFNEPARVERNEAGDVCSVWLSAVSGEGIDLLIEAIGEILRPDVVHTWLKLPSQAGKLRARLFSMGAVVQEQTEASGDWLIEVNTSRRNFNQLKHHENIPDAWMVPSVH